MSFCSFDILSRSGSDIWWLLTFFLYPLWASATHLILSLSFSHLFSCCAATYALLSVSCSICSLYLSWFSSFCVSCLVSNLFWLVLGILWWRCFCPSVWGCIDQDLLVLLIQDNVINLIVNPDILLCYRVSSSLRPSCNLLCWVLEAAVWDEFTILFTEFHQVGTILISSASWPLPNAAFWPSSSSDFAAEIPCQHSNGWWCFIKFLTQLFYLYSFLISFGHFLARSDVGAYTFMMLMILFGFISILLILILHFPVGLHSYCSPSTPVSGFLDSWRTQILSDSLQYLWIGSCHFFGTTNPLP